MKNWSFIVYLVLWIHSLEAGIIRYCVPKKSKHGEVQNACDKLRDQGHQIQCVLAADRLSCYNLMSNGLADFMVAEPEDLSIMMHEKTHFAVTHELKKFAETQQTQFDLEMVVVVKGNSTKEWNSASKKLCYKGLETTYVTQYDNYYNSYFENWLFAETCDSKKTLLENRISKLADNLDSACIAGPWSLDRAISDELKRKYPKLCQLCSNPKTCAKEDSFYGLKGALQCLVQGRGNVAWLSKSDVISRLSDLGTDKYSLLCPDGLLRNISNISSRNDSCTWIMDPRPVIVANKKIAQTVFDEVTDTEDKGKPFYPVIHASHTFSHLRKLEKPEYVADYVAKIPGFLSAHAKSHTSCHSVRTVRWCVSSKLEQRKCQILQKASDALELSPTFSCVIMNSKKESVEGIRDGKCDVILTTPGEEYEAKEFGVKPIIDIVANKADDSNTVAAIVRKNSRFRKFEDLKDAKACFTGYKDVGWNATYWIIKHMNDNDCKNEEDLGTMSRFFKESCVLTLQHTVSHAPENLYSLCNERGVLLGPEERTFQCSMDGADVAFVNVSAAKTFASRSSIFSLNYRILCPNEEDACFVAKINLGSILVHENITKVREDDIYLMFLGLDRYFGRNFDRETPMFKMYEPFEENHDVIFPDATVKLQRAAPNLIYGRYSRNYDIHKEFVCKSPNCCASHQCSIILQLAIFSFLYSYYRYTNFC